MYFPTCRSLAEQLAINEGLSLNAAKTKVFGRTEFLEHLKHLVADVTEEAEGAALERITSSLYFDGDPDPLELETLKSLNLLGYLQEEVGREAFDLGRIRVIFRALKLAKPQDSVDYLITNFKELVVFAKEMTLLMQALDHEFPGCFLTLEDAVLDAILTPPASSVQLIRTWLLELFVRGTVPISTAGIKRLERLSTQLDRRQRLLIRGRNSDKYFFRRHKTGFGQVSTLEQPCLVWGASCLPQDEYEAWLKAVRPIFSMPAGGLFLKWAQSNRAKLASKLNYVVEDLAE